ncbi:hypothetical protein Airi01_012910 [Actinoallomurus iriomotensis]|uniref:DUF8017 domain-containing protein n=2 Tax=Actinoallomurus iriomotensis TaxID=478107 RepID=A0A9W6RBW8_9ACTN|nr:hypothetical protein Airi01_012910 [Actinoallomurus iriomotensis]
MRGMVWRDGGQRSGRSRHRGRTDRGSPYGENEEFDGSGGMTFLPPLPPERSPAGVRAVVVVLVILLVGGGVALAVAGADGHGRRAVAGSSPSPDASRLPSYVPSAPPSARAKVPGWHAVVAVKHGLTYDVPPSTWSVKSADTIVGFEDPNGRPEVAGSGVAIYKEGYCPGHSGSWRAQTAVADYGESDPAAAAKDAARTWATYGYAPGTGGSAPTVTLRAPKPLTTGGSQAMEVTATVTVHDDEPCSPPRGVVHAVAVPLKGGEVSVLIVIADQGVPDATSDTDLEKIARSARPTS